MKQKEPKSLSVKIITTIVLIIIIPIVLIGLIVLYKSQRYPDKIPDIFGYKPMIVLSGSMETSIHVGDLVFVKIIDPDLLKTNDIIAFRNEANKVTTHRIVEVVNSNNEKSFRTKGDNNNANDDKLVKADEVEGIYVSKIKGIGKILMALKDIKTLIIVLLVILVGGLVCLSFADKREKN